METTITEFEKSLNIIITSSSSWDHDKNFQYSVTDSLTNVVGVGASEVIALHDYAVELILYYKKIKSLSKSLW